MAKLKQVSIDFNFKKGKCDVCGGEDLPVAEIGKDNKMAICDICAQQSCDIHNNMKLMRTAE